MNNKKKAFVDEFIRQNGNVPVKIPLKKAVHDAELFYEVTQMSIDLIELIRQESDLKKHHRAYLHVQDELGALPGLMKSSKSAKIMTPTISATTVPAVAVMTARLVLFPRAAKRPTKKNPATKALWQ